MRDEVKEGLEEEEEFEEKPKGTLYWAPRILAILFAIFTSLFALNVFEGGYNFLEEIAALLIHLSPTCIILMALLVAWNWEEIGGIIFITLGLLYIYLVWGHFTFLNYIIIPAPLFIIGYLFVLYSIKTAKKRKKKHIKIIFKNKKFKLKIK